MLLRFKLEQEESKRDTTQISIITIFFISFLLCCWYRNIEIKDFKSIISPKYSKVNSFELSFFRIFWYNIIKRIKGREHGDRNGSQAQNNRIV